MALLRKLNSMLDDIFASDENLARFSRVEPRLYRRETEFAVYEVFFRPSKWWDANEGGEIYADVTCFVPAVQRAVHGVEQSWAAPDFNRPIYLFQPPMNPGFVRGEWKIDATSIENFPVDVRKWLQQHTLPWFQRLTNLENIFQYIAETASGFSAVELLACFDRCEEADQVLVCWLRELPRQIERQLDRLVDCKVITDAERQELRLASIQSNDDYRTRIEAWLERRWSAV